MFLGTKFEHSGFIVGATEEDIQMLSTRDYCCQDIRVYLESDNLPVCQTKPSRSVPKQPAANVVTAEYSRNTKMFDDYEQRQQVKKEIESHRVPEPVWRPVIDEKALLNGEVSRFSTVIDQCFAWNVFSVNSRPVLNQTLSIVTSNIENLTPERYSLFHRAVSLIQQSILQYDGRVHDRMRMDIPDIQKEQLAQITRMMSRLIRTLAEIEKSVTNIHNITSGKVRRIKAES